MSEEKEKERVRVTVETLPNGYALTVDGEKFMYFEPMKLLEGMFYHVGLENLKEIDTNMLDLIMEAILSWPTVGDAAVGQAHKMKELAQVRGDLAKTRLQLSKAEDKVKELTQDFSNTNYQLTLALKRTERIPGLEGQIDSLRKSMSTLERKNRRLEGKLDDSLRENAALMRELAKYRKKVAKKAAKDGAVTENNVDKSKYIRTHTRKDADRLVQEELERQEREREQDNN